jgi:uncharacterized protein YndB with AHSA1/START domain
MRAITTLAAAAAIATTITATGGEQPMILHKEALVEATPQEAWEAWTTAEGLRFISASSNVELAVGGPYEWFLDLEPDADGRRGGEGARVVGWLPGELLVFTWTFPPSIPTLRHSRATTQVVVRFESAGTGRTRVVLEQVGWEEGDDWRRGHDYFEVAWGKVLDRFAAAIAARGTAPDGEDRDTGATGEDE